MIVNHETGAPITLRTLREAFPRICALDNPLLGTDGHRARWADESAPADAELRLIGYSLRVGIDPPIAGEGQQVRPGPLELVNDAWRQTWIVEPIPPPSPEQQNDTTIRQQLDAALADLRIVRNTSGTLTAANLSNAARLLARVQIGVARLVLEKLDGAE